MKLIKVHGIKRELAQYLLLGLPTVLLVGFVLFLANDWVVLLEQQWLMQTLFFTIGLYAALFCFARRFRFFTITAILLLMYSFISFLLIKAHPGEMDAFFWSIRMSTLSIAFFVGWLVGYGFSRSRFFTMAWSAILLCGMVVVIAQTKQTQLLAMFFSTIPVIGYVTYIIYISELLLNVSNTQTGFGWFVTRRLLGFLILVAMVLVGSFFFWKPTLNRLEKDWQTSINSGNNQSQNGGLTKNDGQGINSSSSMGLSGFNNSANKDSVLFVAKLDHFFPDKTTPNPLYFVSDYFSKFDTTTETFETDTLRPYNDLFSPDPSALPLYFVKEDTTVLSKAMSQLNRKVVTAEVYKKRLSPKAFVAPSTAFFVQPISVPEEQKFEFKSAYRAKMLVSDLNSAYFVYNPAGDFGLAHFQTQRFQLLRAVTNFQQVPDAFSNYYTQMPKGASFDSIGQLSKALTANATTTIDKMIAIRDYFLAKDENNQPTFSYSDNPGVPGLPSASKLCYFLFENKKGYCAYFAGATLFMLRSLGIPARIATGFMLVDRSSKNPGWYWVYEDQAHAWVQVWFPGYGWLDFDTTIPSTEQQESPQPDQTPPLTNQTAWLVANGKVLKVDTLAKSAHMLVDKLLYWDHPFEIQPERPMHMDVALARILRDTGQVQLEKLASGDTIVAVSFSEVFKDLPPSSNDINAVWRNFPSIIPVDEIKIIDNEAAANGAETSKSSVQHFNWKIPLFWLLGSILFVYGCLFLSPTVVFCYFLLRCKMASSIAIKAYFTYMTSMFYVHQLGFKRNHLSPLSYAQTIIDPQLSTHLWQFIHWYQQLKYSGQPKTEADVQQCNEHLPLFLLTIRNKISIFKRVMAFLRYKRIGTFFSSHHNYTI